MSCVYAVICSLLRLIQLNAFSILTLCVVHPARLHCVLEIRIYHWVVLQLLTFSLPLWYLFLWVKTPSCLVPFLPSPRLLWLWFFFPIDYCNVFWFVAGNARMWLCEICIFFLIEKAGLACFYAEVIAVHFSGSHASVRLSSRSKMNIFWFLPVLLRVPCSPRCCCYRRQLLDPVLLMHCWLSFRSMLC